MKGLRVYMRHWKPKASEVHSVPFYTGVVLGVVGSKPWVSILGCCEGM